MVYCPPPASGRYSPEYFDCIRSAAGECARVTVEEINVPRWIYVDFAKKKLSGTDSDGEQKTTPIQNIRKADGRWCMAPDPGASWRRIP